MFNFIKIVALNVLLELFVTIFELTLEDVLHSL